MIVKEVAAHSKRVRVTFRFPAGIWAESVCIAGAFNRWQPQDLQLTRMPQEPYWEITLELESGKEFQFRYLINGSTWRNAPEADACVANPLGENNGVVRT